MSFKSAALHTTLYFRDSQTSSKVPASGNFCLDLLTILHLTYPEQLYFHLLYLSLAEIWIEIALSATNAWKLLHLTCFRDFIFHLYELSNLVTITLPPMCIIVVWTSFQKMEVNIPKHASLSLIQGRTCQKNYQRCDISAGWTPQRQIQ